MARYRAIISVEFDSEDLKNLAEGLGIENMDPDEAVQGELDGFGLGTGWIENIFRNGEPMMHRLSDDGIQITVNDHDLDGSEEEEDDDFLHCGGDDEDDDD